MLKPARFWRYSKKKGDICLLPIAKARGIRHKNLMTCNEAKAKIPVRAIFRHFKGNLYEVIAIAKDTETEEPTVIYQDMNKRGIIWTRPASMLFDEVSRGTKRFERYQCGMHVLTSEGWKPAKPIEYEPPNPPLWAKPLIWLFDWYMRRKKNNGHDREKKETMAIRGFNSLQEGS